MANHLKMGQTVEIRQDKITGTYHYKTVVEAFENDVLYVYAPMSRGLPVLFAMNERVKLIYSDHDPETNMDQTYEFSAQVVDRERREKIVLVGLKKMGPIKKIQRRDFYRVSFVKDMSMSMDVENGETFHILTKDVSAGGVRCVTNKRLTMGDRVKVNLSLIDDQPLEIKGSVVGVELMPDSVMRYVVRVQFPHVTKASQEALIHQINHLQGEYLKKLAEQRYEHHLDGAMSHMDEERLHQIHEDNKFALRLGYLMALDWLMFLVFFMTVVYAKPVYSYPVAKFFNVLVNQPWNNQLLYLDMGVALVIIVLSMVGLMLDRLKFGQRRPPSKSLIFLLVFGILALLTLAVLFSTVLVLPTFPGY